MFNYFKNLKQRRTWVTVGVISVSYYANSKDKIKITFYLKENLLGKRDFEVLKTPTLVFDNSHKGFDEYHKIVVPWYNGACLKEIPSAWDVYSNTKNSYVN